ncbi:hypothetical protein FGB62_107g03 [Gracilaria domingensis]|nr:hypothetical protein FGB62_107g03 [Gracilaria domingensis]
MLFYFVWRAIIGREDSIALYFLIAAHTRNTCDGSFGLVKRRIKERNDKTLAQIMCVIEDSASSNTVIPASLVNWVEWKKRLVFTFETSKPGKITVKELVKSTDDRQFKHLKRGVSLADVVAGTLSDSISNLKAPCKCISLVSSAQKENREDYFIKNVLKRYYSSSHEIAAVRFATGAGLAT